MGPTYLVVAQRHGIVPRNARAVGAAGRCDCTDGLGWCHRRHVGSTSAEGVLVKNMKGRDTTGRVGSIKFVFRHHLNSAESRDSGSRQKRLFKRAWRCCDDGLSVCPGERSQCMAEGEVESTIESVQGVE
jgi:hypothetical protein